MPMPVSVLVCVVRGVSRVRRPPARRELGHASLRRHRDRRSQCVEEFGQGRGIAAHVICGVDRDPAPRPRREIQRANHGWSVPVGCDGVWWGGDSRSRSAIHTETAEIPGSTDNGSERNTSSRTSRTLGIALPRRGSRVRISSSARRRCRSAAPKGAADLVFGQCDLLSRSTIGPCFRTLRCGAKVTPGSRRMRQDRGSVRGSAARQPKGSSSTARISRRSDASPATVWCSTDARATRPHVPRQLDTGGSGHLRRTCPRPERWACRTDWAGPSSSVAMPAAIRRSSSHRST